MTRIQSETRAVRFTFALQDSAALYARDQDAWTYHARQTALWQVIESTGEATLGRTRALIDAQQARRVTLNRDTG